MKKEILFILLALTMVGALVLGACAKPAPAETIKLTYSNFFPPTNLNSILAEQFCAEIKARTNGGIEITYYPTGTLTPAAGIYDGVVNGISDIGMSCFTYTMGRFPASELVDLPHAYPNGWVATKVANDFYQEFKPAELNDVHVLYLHAHGPGVVFTTKKPVRTLEDLQGLQIRGTGVGVKIMDTLGAKGVGKPQGEAYELLSKGTVDGSFAPLEVLKGWKQAEVVNYVTNCYAVGNTTDMFVVINKAKWDSLPANIQKVFTEVSKEWIEKHAKAWTYSDKSGVDFLLTFEGRELIQLPPDEMAKWVEAANPLIEQYITEKTAKGLPAADYEKYIAERVKYWSAKSPSEAACVEWAEKELVPK
ncbi:MAG: TRAP transporter substrate-binding protein [Chloroflexi bacterium]|nr:TRAP transporter substrate-binding protein [Chloroflexota bacterium]